ncbi:MAG: PKD domain-containing protein, partial [Anaerolineae bacterium]|nr:PKD domain-containing protein [Anaerolineae bacterium]
NSISTIRLDPAAGPLNTTVTVIGEGWQPERSIFIYLTSPYSLETDLNNFAQANAVTDSAGRFSVTLPIPASSDWEAPGLVRVVARTAESEAGAQAFFSLLDDAIEPTATVTDTIAAATPTLTPTVSIAPTDTPEPDAEAAMLVTNADLNVRSGPGTDYTILGLLKADQTAEITGLSPDGRWWQIAFSGTAGGRGWVAAQYTIAQNTDNVPIVQAQPVPTQPTAIPQPTAKPVVISEWRGEYYNNPTMSGNPVIVRNDSSINFNWGTGAPVAGVGADNFSARWTRTIYFAAGNYRFQVRADDGVLLWVDDNLIVDQWHDSSATTYTANVYLTEGSHTVKMAYYERVGDAVAQLNWEAANSYPDWQGAYFNNTNVSGAPVLVRNDSAINFNWGSNSPGAGVPADNFSVRWTRQASFSAGTYRFSVTVDDGVRLWVDDRLVVDQWRETAPTTYTADVTLSDGSHTLKMEYFDRWYDAQAHLSWSRVDSYPDWKAEYYSNRKLQGNPVLVRNDKKIDFDWGRGTPAGGLPADDFSVRWSRKIDFDGGMYRFKATVDDGMRLWLDDKLLIDSWQDGETRHLEVDKKVSDGKHWIEVEYYERNGDAEIKVGWEEIDDEPTSNQPPQAVLNGPYTVKEGSALSVNGNGSYDPDGQITQYEWDFDYNGSTFSRDASGPSVSIPYNDGPASSLIALRVTDNKNASRIATAKVTVQNVPPTANAGGPYSVQLGNALGFVGQGNDPGSVDQASLEYRWDFGDGSQGERANVAHAYDKAGTYTVQLTVIDKDGGQASSKTQVTVTQSNQPPQAVIKGSPTGIAGEAVTFNGNNSTDSDGSIISYAWNFGDGATGSGAKVNHVYNAAGRYQVTLTVTDNGNLTNSATVDVEISAPAPDPIPPQAVISGATSGLVDAVMAFSGSKSSDSDGTITRYDWDFGDGTTGNGVDVNHTYSASGSYTVKLTVTDNTDLSSTAAIEVKIDEPIQIQIPPEAVIGGSTSGVVNQPMSFDALGSSDADGTIVNYVWDFGDNRGDNGVEVTHIYEATGSYTVTLTVTDDQGLTNSAERVVDVVAESIDNPS